MAKDHFVAQTYLKHWCDPRTSKLRGYKKAEDESFPCSPKDVCHEWNWDINPLFEEKPELLADYRRIFEPQWNPTVGAVRSGRLSSEDKFVVAGYWALLTTCTPTWHSHAVKVYEQQLLDFIPMVAEHIAQQRPEDREFIEKAIAERRIVPDVDDDYVKGILTKHLTNTTIMLYQQDWIILQNATRVPFITSDNPSSVFPRRKMMEPLVRFLPLGPDIAILTVINLRKRREELKLPDLSGPPPGKCFRRQLVHRKDVVKLNRITVMNADQFVFASSESKPVRRLVRNHRRFGLAVDRVKITGRGAPLTASTLVVRQIAGP
jgi:hypothetical protein